jgi:multimeric flavodoxin WrbA
LIEAGGPGPLILLGSARSDGDTAGAAQALAERLQGATLIDLRSKKVRPFDYANSSAADDFSSLADLMLAHGSVIFATPVYWYAMSGVMKIFFDRLSDLLSGRDPERRGRRLAGREVWLLAVGSDPALPSGFELPFAETARYLGMIWRGGYYVRSGSQPDSRELDALAQALQHPPERRNA